MSCWSMMSVLRSYLAEFVAVFVTSDVQMLFLTIALAGSLCCSIIWRLCILLSAQNGLCVATAKYKISKHHKMRRTVSNKVKFDSYFTDESCFRQRPMEKHVQTACQSYTKDSCLEHGLPSYSSATIQQKLLYFDRSFSGLTQCPRRIGFLGTQLVCLNLSHNGLSSLPDEIGCLLGLEEMHLSHNQLKFLPETIRSLRRLMVLDLQSNELTSLGDGLTSLTHLRLLLINNNMLTDLSSEFHQLRSLEQLDISFNSLTFLPAGLCSFINLVELNISNNPLSCLPEKMNRLVHLTHLQANVCQLVTLPHSICGCTQLVTLHLSRNRLRRLPNGIGRLFSLQFLSLDGNRLQYLPVTILHLQGCHILVENNCFISPMMNSPVVINMTRGIATTMSEHLQLSGAISLLEQAAICLFKNDIKWQHENIPQTLKDILNDVQYCICCDQPLFLWQRMQITSHSLVGKTGKQTLVPLAQSTCPLQMCLKTPCTFMNF